MRQINSSTVNRKFSGPLSPVNGSHLFAGGRDTAGQGGKGGPYRLDAGHEVYQVSQAEKDAVPEEIRRAAREMAEKAFKVRLADLTIEFHVMADC